MSIDRLFSAILPPQSVAADIVGQFGRLGYAAMAADRLHITLYILDDREGVDRRLVASLRAVGDALAVVPVGVTLDRLVASPRSVALRPARRLRRIDAVHAGLARLARAAGIVERRDYRFAAHLTLGYREAAPSSRPIAPIGWIADEMVLIHSHVGRTRHDILGRWPLRGPPDPQLSLL